MLGTVFQYPERAQGPSSFLPFLVCDRGPRLGDERPGKWGPPAAKLPSTAESAPRDQGYDLTLPTCSNPMLRNQTSDTRSLVSLASASFSGTLGKKDRITVHASGDTLENTRQYPMAGRLRKRTWLPGTPSDPRSPSDEHKLTPLARPTS